MSNDLINSNPVDNNTDNDTATPSAADTPVTDAAIPADAQVTETNDAAAASADSADNTGTASESDITDTIDSIEAPAADTFSQAVTAPQNAEVPVAAATTPEPAVYAQATPPVPPYQAPPYVNPAAKPANNAPVYTAPAQGSPQYYPNGQQVYYTTVPTVPEKKTNKGKIAFLICLWVLIGMFAIGFFVMCGYVAGLNSDTDNTRPTLFGEYEETEPETTIPDEDTTVPADTEAVDIVPLPDSNDNDYSKDSSVDLRKIPADYKNTDKYTTKYAYKKAIDSTVGIVCYTDSFSGDPASQGTGIIITDDGYVVTNSHVIGDSRTAYKVQVITTEGTNYEAKIIGYDSRTDLAVLKINATNLPAAEFCDSDTVEVGEDVIAVGSPGGMEFQNSLTRGVVSALDRELSLNANVSYIQTDAAINPGNSGGPLCNMYGQVIGINTAKISSDSYEGMGFAIPSRTVKEIVDDLMSQGFVSGRVRIGISGQAVTTAMEQYYRFPKGILVGEITEGGPCDGSGLKINDIITAIDGEKVTSFAEVYKILGEHKPGDKITLSVYRADSEKELEIEITLMADEGETQR